MQLVKKGLTNKEFEEKYENQILRALDRKYSRENICFMCHGEFIPDVYDFKLELKYIDYSFKLYVKIICPYCGHIDRDLVVTYLPIKHGVEIKKAVRNINKKVKVHLKER